MPADDLEENRGRSQLASAAKVSVLVVVAGSMVVAVLTALLLAVINTYPRDSVSAAAAAISVAKAAGVAAGVLTVVTIPTVALWMVDHRFRDPAGSRST